MFRLDEKLARIRSGQYKQGDFIIADAKDGEMALPINSSVKRAKDGSLLGHYTRPEFMENIRQLVEQDILDIMLLAASTFEDLNDKGVFRNSRMKPAIRANDTTDCWVGRGATYRQHPARPFRSVSLSRVTTGTIDPAPGAPIIGTDLGLYAVTFNNDLESDLRVLEAFKEFRVDAARNNFKYFLEVFNPNVDAKIDPEVLPFYMNDQIMRCIAGLHSADRPQFLKIVYNGPKALEELCSYDPGVAVGILGGGAGTTRDCFELLHQGEKYGARVALFGRKINLAEDPLAMVTFMRQVADHQIKPAEAVKAYHGSLQKNGIKPIRDLDVDNEITEAVLKGN